MNETTEKPAAKKRQGSPLRVETYIGVDVPPQVKQAAMLRAEKEGRTLASYIRRLIEKEVL